MAEKEGAGGKPQQYDPESGKYTGEETKRLSRHFMQNNGSLRGYVSGADASSITLSREEYGALRAEVMRKNVAQKGNVKPTNFAYTANYFYVYDTIGDDSFTPLIQLDIEKDGDLIDDVEEFIKNGFNG